MNIKKTRKRVMAVGCSHGSRSNEKALEAVHTAYAPAHRQRHRGRIDSAEEVQDQDRETRNLPHMALPHKPRRLPYLTEDKLTDQEVRELREQAPTLIAKAIKRGWISPPKYRLTENQIDSLMRR